MYCSDCGAESHPSVKYCPKCGALLGATADLASPRGVPFALVGLFGIIIGALGLVGFLGLIEGTRDLASTRLNGDQVVAIAGCAVFLVVGVIALLIWFLIKLLNMYGVPQQAASTKAPRANRSLPSQPVAQLAPPPRGMASVTEHTTRHFDRARAGGPTGGNDTADME
jgi:hypothetical protein